MHIEDPFGNKKEYTPEKIIDSVQRAGFSEEDAKQIEQRVRETVTDGMRSRELYAIVYREMKKINEAYALRYRLREAIGALDPQHHEFEKYMARVLERDGIETEWSPRPLPQGACSEHEVDIVGERDGERYAIECKHHFHYHRLTGMDVPMIQWALLDDLQQGYEQGLEHAVDVDTAWVIVNTKLSEHAKRYAACRGITMTAWNHPEHDSLREIVERNNAYPVTILQPHEEYRTTLAQHDVLLVQELLQLSEQDKTDLGIPNQALTNLQRKARRLLNGETLN